MFSHKAAERYEAENVQPDGQHVQWLDAGSFHTIEIELPYSKNSKLKVRMSVSVGLVSIDWFYVLRIYSFVYSFRTKLNVRLRTASQTRVFDATKAGKNSPKPDEIQHCLVIGSDDCLPHVDIDIITGRFTKYPHNDSLLLLHVYNFKDKVEIGGKKWPSNVQLQSLHKLCLNKLCKRGGHEAKRSGALQGCQSSTQTCFASSSDRVVFQEKGVESNLSSMAINGCVFTYRSKGNLINFQVSCLLTAPQSEVASSACLLAFWINYLSSTILKKRR